MPVKVGVKQWLLKFADGKMNLAKTLLEINLAICIISKKSFITFDSIISLQENNSKKKLCVGCFHCRFICTVIVKSNFIFHCR